eukprot:1662317-Rhodomonas_salina.3
MLITADLSFCSHTLFYLAAYPAFSACLHRWLRIYLIGNSIKFLSQHARQMDSGSRAFRCSASSDYATAMRCPVPNYEMPRVGTYDGE